MGHLKSRSQPLRRCGDQASKSVLVPIHKPGFRRLAFDDFAAIAGRFFLELQVFDHVFGRLRHDPAALIEAFAPGPTGNLVKIARAQDEGLFAVKFA